MRAAIAARAIAPESKAVLCNRFAKLRQIRNGAASCGRGAPRTAGRGVRYER